MDHPNIFIINGKPRSGKDTFVEILSKIYTDYTPEGSVVNISSVDKIKEAAKILGWNGEKTGEARKFLSDLKALSTEFNDGPANYCYEQAEKLKDNQLLFIHCREPEEIDKMKILDCFTVYVRRPMNDENPTNRSDAEVTNYKYDYIIDNNGSLEDLESTSKLFMNTLFDLEYYFSISRYGSGNSFLIIDSHLVKVDCKAYQRL